MSSPISPTWRWAASAGCTSPATPTTTSTWGRAPTTPFPPQSASPPTPSCHACRKPCTPSPTNTRASAPKQSTTDIQRVSSAIRDLTLEIIRIANDMRLLASGPRTGIGEILLPAVQPGSSIMPGKVNPVMFEMLNQVCFQVLGQDSAIAHMTQAGQLELNVMMPAMGSALFDAMDRLTNGSNAATEFILRVRP